MKLSSKQKKLIVAAIDQAEHLTSGEIRVHLSYSSSEDDVMATAQKQFEKLKMHETVHKNGVLLYINPRAKKFALYGDTGIHQKVGQAFWDDLKEQLQKNIREKDLTTGIVHAVGVIGDHLKRYFPHLETDKNQLPNDVSES